MNDQRGPAAIVTPEAVALELDIAGAGSRLIAFAMDGLIIVGSSALLFLSGLALSAMGIPEPGLIVFGISLTTLAVLGYFPLLEGLRGGQTIGKSWQKLRVIQVDGRPITWQSSLVRNLMRLVDMIGLVGLFFIIGTKRSQRLGDLAAGTIVVHEHTSPMPHAIDLPPDEKRDIAAATLDTSLLTHSEYLMIRSFLERRDSLSREAREQLVDQIAKVAGQRLRINDYGMPKETFLEAVLLSVRRRNDPARYPH